MAGEDKTYVAWVRTQPCAAAHLGVCYGGIEAHHNREQTGLSLKPHDHQTIPLCRQHHAEWHSAAGTFSRMGKEARRRWGRRAVTATRRRWDGQGGGV